MGTSAIEGNGGAGVESGGQGGAGTQQGSQPPVGGNAQGTPGAAAGQGVGGGEGSLDRSKLSPALRALSEDQLNDLVGTMFQAIANRGGGTGADAPPAPPAPDPEPDYREYFDPASDKFNPKAAVADLVTRNYGPLIRDIGNRAVQGAFGRFREDYPDFKEYERDISQALTNSGVVNPTDQQITALYFTARGQRAALAERAARSKAQNSPPPSPANAPTTPREEPLDDDEKLIARRMFPNAQDPEKAYRDAAREMEQGTTTRKVPMGGGVRQ